MSTRTLSSGASHSLFFLVWLPGSIERIASINYQCLISDSIRTAHDAASETEMSTVEPLELNRVIHAVLERSTTCVSLHARNSLFVLHVSPPIHRRSPSLSHERLFPIRGQVPLLVALRGSSKPIVPRGARRIAIGPMQVSIGLDHLYVRKDFYFAFCTFSFISFCFRPAALYSGIPSYFGPFTISDTTPLTPCNYTCVSGPLLCMAYPSSLRRIQANKECCS
jgi:hypothetical protein